MARPGDGVELGAPLHGKGASSRPPAGRVCAIHGCSTVLSTYNSSSYCWLHSPMQYKPSRGPAR